MEKLKRASGVLMHITSMPNEFTLGTFSDDCFKFVDWLKEGGFSIWQVLPITDTGIKVSPYSATSTFAISPYLVDLSKFLTTDEMRSFGFDKNNNIHLEQEKILLALDLVYDKHRKDYDISEFENTHKSWLEDYALYRSIQKVHDGKIWCEWPEGLKTRQKSAIDKFKVEHAREIDIVKFTQFIAYEQWNKIKKYANDNGIKIFGDIPFYIELNSSDVWSNVKSWKIDKDGRGDVAGVPPDYFNKDGQWWGNPIYNYEEMEKNGFKFFINRFKHQSQLFDIIRIDHFLAFTRYWSIPYGKLAKQGKWQKGVGEKALDAITSKVKIPIVVEDLGTLNEEVHRLRHKYDMPGLKVLQFAFDSEGDNEYQPHNWEKDCVAYIGTHDNDTFMGLLEKMDWEILNRFKRYVRIPLEWGNDAVIDNSIISMYRSSANTIILTMQDILKLGSSARMNIPGTPEDNWLWQLDSLPSTDLCAWYKELANLYAR